MHDRETPIEFPESLDSDGWSNAACCGYVMLACKSLQYTKDASKNILNALNAVFTNYTLQEAEIAFYKALV